MKGFLLTTIGKKFLVAVTGIILFGFVLGHMAGNLKTFLGVDPGTGFHHLDMYAAFLRTMGELLVGKGTMLWIVRAVLLVSVLLHVYLVIGLWTENRRARPTDYQYPQQYNTSYASRSMMLTGILLAVFVIYHLLHFTFGVAHTHGFTEGHVYANVYNAFRVWWVALIYLAAMAVLGLHVYHAVWSFFQTLGLDNPDRNRGLRVVAKVSAIVLFLGFISVPVAISAGLMPEPPAKFVEF